MFIHTGYEGKFDWILMILAPLYANVTRNMTLLDVFLHLFLIACENGTYGQECKGICGNCLEGNSCSHTNGTCLNGCETGYFGDLCKTGKYLNYDNARILLFNRRMRYHLYSYSYRIYINSKPKCIVTYTVLLVM